MCHNRATRSAIGPEPDERHALDALSPQAEQKEPFDNGVHGIVNGPPRKAQTLPITHVQPLQTPSKRRRNEGSERIVGALPRSLSRLSAVVPLCCVALEPQVVDDLCRIERDADVSVTRADIGERLVEPGRFRRAISVRTATPADAAAEGEIAGRS